MRRIIRIIILIIFVTLMISGCTLDAKSKPLQNNQSEDKIVSKNSNTSRVESLIYENGRTVEDRIKVPKGFERVKVEDNSYEYYLRNLPLKPHGSKVKLYNGEFKNKDAYAAVLDIDVGDRDLQQCADAIIRLRSEYLYSQRLYGKIHFNFTNGFYADYSTWMDGKRIKVEGNKAYWVKSSESNSEYNSFRKYLNMVFSYAGTLSLSKELKRVAVEDMQIGDVFIKGASPGHAVIIIDMAQNKLNNEKIFMTAQSYMPAQDIHILKNITNEEISPWYSANFGEKLNTPEWEFDKNQLMRFEN